MERKENSLIITNDEKKGIMISIEDRIKGSLFGLAWGDIFGCPIEGWKEGEIFKVFKIYKQLPEEYPFDKISFNMGRKYLKKLRPLGLHSDDTQQCLALLNCCISSNYKWNKFFWCKFLKQGMATHAWRGFGKNFSLSVSNLKKGIEPERSGSPSSGIGAAMRIGPLGSLYRDNLLELEKVVWESSLITHGTLQAASLSWAVAYSVARLVTGDSVEKIRELLPSVVLERVCNQMK